MENSDLKTKHLAWHHCTCAVSGTGITKCNHYNTWTGLPLG